MGKTQQSTLIYKRHIGSEISANVLFFKDDINTNDLVVLHTLLALKDRREKL